MQNLFLSFFWEMWSIVQRFHVLPAPFDPINSQTITPFALFAPHSMALMVVRSRPHPVVFTGSTLTQLLAGKESPPLWEGDDAENITKGMTGV